MDSTITDKHKALHELNKELEARVQERTDELQKSELKFRETIELAGDGIFEADISGLCMSVNPAGCRMLGFQEHELVGKPANEFVPAEEFDKLQRVLEHHANSDEIIQMEWNLRCKDGSLLPVEINARTVKGDRIVAFVRDMSVRKKAESALVASEKKFRTVFEGAYDSILVADESGRIKMVNKQLREKFGYLQEELIGQPMELLIPEYAHSRHKGAGLELFGRKKDGSEFPVDISLSPTNTEVGLRVTAIIRDITQRKKFEEQYKFLAEMGRVLEEAFDYDEKIEKLAELLATRIADSCVIKVVENGELVYKASATRQKNEAEEFKKSAKIIVMPGGHGSVHVFKTGMPIIIEDTKKEILDNPNVDQVAKDIVTKFGTRSYAIFPLMSQGRPVGTITLSSNSRHTEITKGDADFLKIVSNRCAVAIENARLHKYSRLAEVVTNNLPSMISYWDKNEICQFANKAYMDWFGVTPEQVVGMYTRDLLGEELYKLNGPYIKRVLGGQTQHFERDFVKNKTGEIRHTNVLYIPDIIHNETVGFFVLIVDVSEIKDAVQVREEVLAVVSHDLKNPLASISLSADLLNQDKILPWPLVRDFGSRIQRAVNQMQLLISDLLDFAKMESSTFAVELKAENPGDIISQVADSFKALAQKKEITIRVNKPKHAKFIACDSGRIVQVLSNLIGNSLKFSPDGSEITLGIADAKEGLLFSVADNGPGIPSEQLSKVFDRFWQAEKAQKIGSGLGLSIAKGIVQAHKGEIWVESQAAQGTTFYFTIPYATSEQFQSHEIAEEQNTPIAEDALLGDHILLVDDSEDNIVSVKMILEKVGAKVSLARTAREALTVIEKYHPDLVITDIEMPDVNGFQLLAEVRKAIGKNIPVISFSAHSTGLQYEKIKNSGFDGNIFKPVKPDALVDEVTRVLHSSH